MNEDFEDTHEFKSVTLCPDYGGPWAWIDPDNIDGECHCMPVGDGDSWYGACPMPESLIASFAQWQTAFNIAPWDSTEHAILDWASFHQRGLELAIALKRALGQDIRVIYQKPFEDPGREDMERAEVLADGSLKLLPSFADG